MTTDNNTFLIFKIFFFPQMVHIYTAVAFLGSLVTACVDDDAKLQSFANQMCPTNPPSCDIKGCVDVGALCSADGAQGDKIRELCCLTCTPPTDDILPSLPPSGAHVFLLAGQSNCVGQASKSLLNRDGNFPELVGEQSGVWFAGYRDNLFYNSTMEAGKASNMFGPEISFGQRYHELSGAPVLIVKYCWGGSKVSTHWNPTTTDNSWDTAMDEGTAAWLLANKADLRNKDKLFANLVYTARLAQEELEAAGVEFEWRGFLWVQGAGDADSTWLEYASNLSQMYDEIRTKLQEPQLPIVDTGSSNWNQVRSGKEHARHLVQGCQSAVAEWNMGAYDVDTTCIPSPETSCFFNNYDLYNTFGWDPAVPESEKPAGSSTDTLRCTCMGFSTFLVYLFILPISSFPG